MRLSSPVLLMISMAFAMPAFATVAVSSPSNNSTVGSSVAVVASSTTACSLGVASSGVYVDNVLKYVVASNVVNTTISLSPGKHWVVVQEWDYCGQASNAPLSVTVATTAGISVTSPANGSVVTAQVPFVASAASSCPAGVAAMGVYVNNALVYKTAGSTLNAPIALGVGPQYACLLYTSPSPRDGLLSRMPSSA